MSLRRLLPSSRSSRTGLIRRFLWTSVLPCAALVAACSSSSEGTSTTSSSSMETGAATSVVAASSSSGGTGGAGGESTSTGAGGATCPACITVAELPTGSHPHGLFVDADHLYWTNFGTGEVMQANLDGSSPITLQQGEMAPIAVQARGGFVYWVSYSETGVARRAPVGGGPVEDLAPAAAARELFVGPDFLWWTGEPDDVWRAPLSGLTDGGLPDLLTNNVLANGLTGDDTGVYWVNRFDGRVKRADLALGTETILANGDVPWDIVVDETNVYWTEQGSKPGAGKVMRASKIDGAGATMIAAEPQGLQGLAIDASRVYWASKVEGTIKSAPLAGGAVSVLAAGQDRPVNVAVDGAFVYWTSMGGDAVVKVPK